jgi:aminoglycoside phosphotransferase family enzyme
MDLEFHGKDPLSWFFLDAYQQRFPSMFSADEEALLVYYKLYRANVRLKNLTLSVINGNVPIEQANFAIQRYALLMENYLTELNKGEFIYSKIGSI